MTDETNQIARRTEAREIVVCDPFAPDTFHADPQAVIASMQSRKTLRAAQYDALGDLAAAPLDAVKALAKAVADDDKTLLDYEKRLNAALLDLSGFKAVIVQMKGAKANIDQLSVRGKFREIIGACKARIEAEEPPEPMNTFIVRMTCTGKALGKIRKAAEKLGVDDFCWRKAQSDKAVRQIAAWFEENAEG